MSAEWKVAAAGSRGLAVWDGNNWRWGHAGTVCVDQPPPGLRPLVLIDPEDREQVERLYALYASASPGKGVRGSGFLAHALRQYASPTPPKPDEPMGLGAVVVDSNGEEWLRAGRGGFPWMRVDTNVWRDYGAISAVEIKGAGVES